MALLYIDLLGVRAHWHSGGRADAEDAFAKFRAALQRALQDEPGVTVLHGGVESDSAAVVFSRVQDAISVGCRLYRNIFSEPRQQRDRRFWIRGAVMPAPQVAQLRSSAPLPEPFQSLHSFSYEPELLEAISVEKSGIKGMRLLIAEDLLSRRLEQDYRVRIGSVAVIPFRHLDHSSYPGRVAQGFRDILWMVERTAWRDMQIQMATRLRWAASDPEEFVQAAATQVVFHECAAIIAVGGRLRPRVV